MNHKVVNTEAVKLKSQSSRAWKKLAILRDDVDGVRHSVLGRGQVKRL